MAVFRLLLVILNVLFIILCMIECSGDLEASYSAVPYKMDFTSIFKGRFSSGRKAVRQTPCRIHSGRQSRPHSSRFDRICSFFRAYRLEKGSVSSMRIFAESVCQPYARFRKQADFSPVCGCFPCVRCTHKKINISATKGVVFVSGEPWVGSP